MSTMFTAADFSNIVQQPDPTPTPQPAPQPAPAPPPPPEPAPLPDPVPIPTPTVAALDPVPAALDPADAAETALARRSRGLAGTIATSPLGVPAAAAALAAGRAGGSLGTNALMPKRKSLLGE